MTIRRGAGVWRGNSGQLWDFWLVMKSFHMFAAAFLVVLVKSEAAVVINVTQSGNNVVANIAGSINSLVGATPRQTNANASNYNAIAGSSGAFWSSPSGGTSLYNNYSVTSVPASFGTSGFTSASSSTATTNFFVRRNTSPQLWIPVSYTLGTPMTGTLTWDNKTIASLGLTEGTYLWGWTGDSVTLNIGSAAIPEPSAALLGVAGVGLLFRRRRAWR